MENLFESGFEQFRSKILLNLNKNIKALIYYKFQINIMAWFKILIRKKYIL